MWRCSLAAMQGWQTCRLHSMGSTLLNCPAVFQSPSFLSKYISCYRTIGAPESAAASAGDMSRLQSQGSGMNGSGMNGSGINGSGIAGTARSGSFAQVGDMCECCHFPA